MFSRSILIILLLLPSAWSRRYLKPGPKTKNTKSSPAPSFQPSSSEKASPGADDFDQLRPVFNYVRDDLKGLIVESSISFGGQFAVNKYIVDQTMELLEFKEDAYAYKKRAYCKPPPPPPLSASLEVNSDEAVVAIPCAPVPAEPSPSIEYRPAATGSVVTAQVQLKSRTLGPVSATVVCTMLDGSIASTEQLLPLGVEGPVTCNIDICAAKSNDCVFLRSNGGFMAYRFVPNLLGSSLQGKFEATITSGSGKFLGYIGEARGAFMDGGMSISIAALGFPGSIPGGDIWSVKEASFGDQKPDTTMDIYPLDSDFKPLYKVKEQRTESF